MPMDHSEVPVLICGGGPVGLALAVELGLRGIGFAVSKRQYEIIRVTSW